MAAFLTMIASSLPAVNDGSPDVFASGSFHFLSFVEKNQSWMLAFVAGLLLCLAVICIVLLIKYKKRQRKEMNLLESYNSLADNMPVGYQQGQLIYNRKGNPVDYVVTAVNSEFEEQFAQSHDIAGMKGSDVDSGLMAELINRYKIILAGKTKRVNFAYYHKESGHYFNIIIASSNKPDSMDMFFIDTTELLKTQQSLHAANNKLSMILNITDIVPWRWEIKDKEIFLDHTFSSEHRLNAPANNKQSQIIGEDEYYRRIHHEDRDRIRKAFKELTDGSIPKAKEEYRFLDVEEGNVVYEWIEMQAVVTRKDESGNPLSLTGFSLVITERKEIEAELLCKKEKAEEINRLKAAFLANMSHGIRTSLNAILGFSNVLASTDDEEKRNEYIAIIENSNDLLLRLVGDILDLSRVETGTMDMFYRKVNLNRIMEEQVEPVLKKACQGVNVIFEQQEDNGTVLVEKNRFLQVLTNLLANAAKFTERGEIRFGYEMPGDKMLHVYVTDTGKGIPADQLENIFGRFVMLDPFKPGTGLGLFLSKKIVEYFGGAIGVESEEGKGSTFWFTFPYKKLNTKDTDTDSEQVFKYSKERVKVLVAEDVASNFQLLDHTIGQDFDLIHAWDGKEAVMMFKKHNPHIVLMDIKIPKLNGYEAIGEIRKLSKDVPIIAVTAYAFPSDEEQIMKNGFDAYSPKPLNMPVLKKQIIDLLQPKAVVQ